MSQESDLNKHDDLDALLQSLPREIEPPRDLWPGIAARRPDLVTHAEARREAPQPTTADHSASLWRRLSESLRFPILDSWQGWAWQGAFATLCLLIGTTLGLSLAEPEEIRPTSSPATVSGQIMPAAASAAPFENDLLRLKADLWSTAYARRGELSDETLYVVETNLRIIDSALRDLHIALEADPGNRRLQERIVDQHRKEIELLRRLASGAGNA